MELVDPTINFESKGNSNAEEKPQPQQQQQQEKAPKEPAMSSTPHHPHNHGAREGWGTPEATEMITNNIFYITVKVKNYNF